ncbi:phosphotransferase [Microbacterium azadirachtae]|uniref:phosphotransferase n=1 Tax=Microbacterium azadirachtae TaxID=582680 RepID=UPI0008856510|nr:phosphotransferase [Microbacterium azadirachtae]SDM26986.1 Phosphotransferase enzyme family protein [Microbacterium azadirachtae]SEG49650.1 Phosphotransferase enzyme family protein [Microbacterium azadirachtae]SEG50417.1 Phosphotransferase enzyme family protein [Microbacterium azadirachtae]
MARSPFTLAAAVTAAVPGADVVGARVLSSDGDARFDSAVATLADGTEVAIRASNDDDTASELAKESLALRALTPGARSMLRFAAPEHLGDGRVGDSRALVTTLLPGFQIDAADLPPGPGAAVSIGKAIAGVHALPVSVVRGAGLAERTPAEARDDVRVLIDRAAATGGVSARLTVRWREAVEADDLWRFESAVTLGGAHAESFLFSDDDERGPRVTGILGWHALSIGDPAIDLAWLTLAADARDDVLDAYASATLRAPDTGLGIRARLLAELELARWLLHGHDTHRPDIVDDAAHLLDALADGIHDDLAPRAGAGAGVDEAMSALDRVPATGANRIDTSMQTDTYDASAFAGIATDDTSAFGPRGGSAGGAEDAIEGRGADDVASTHPDAADADRHAQDLTATGAIEDLDPNATEDLSDLRPSRSDSGDARLGRSDDDEDDDRAARPGTLLPSEGGIAGSEADVADAHRAARAAFQRWTSASSE